MAAMKECQGHHRPLDRLADRPGSFQALGGDDARFDLPADLRVDPPPPACPEPVGETHEQARAQQEHDGREEVVLEPVVVDARKLASTRSCPDPTAGSSRPGRAPRALRVPVP